MSLTDRDKKLLIVLLVIIILAGTYLFAYKPVATKAKDLEFEISNLQVQYNQIQAGLSDRSSIEKNNKNIKSDISLIEKKLPPEISQEWILQQVNELEQTLELYFPKIDFSNIEIISSTETEMGIKIDISTNFIGSYSQLKGLLNYINNQQEEKRVVINNLMVTNNLEEGILIGTFDLSYYGLISPARLPRFEEIEGYSIGKDSIFRPFDSYILNQYNDEELSTKEIEDFIVMLKPISSDYTTVIIGESNDAKAKSYVHEDKNEIVEIEMQILQEGDTYYYRYKTPSESMPEDYKDKVAFEPGEKIEIKIYSDDRNSENDKSGVSTTIINESDIPVTITNYHDDENNPRFKLAEKYGNVIDARGE